VTATYRLVVLGVVPFGALTGGFLGAIFGVQQTFFIAAIGLALAACALARRITTAALRNAEST
jgi:hypothetical protein